MNHNGQGRLDLTKMKTMPSKPGGKLGLVGPDMQPVGRDAAPAPGEVPIPEGGALVQLLSLFKKVIDTWAEQRERNPELRGQMLALNIQLGEPAVAQLFVMLGVAQVGAVLLADLMAREAAGELTVPKEVREIKEAFDACLGLKGLEEDPITTELVAALA